MTTYYVDPVSGNNGNAGTSFATAFATTAQAETVVAAGDEVRLCATGSESLTGTNTIILSASGSGTAYITWRGYNATGTAPLAAGSYYTIDASGMTAGSDTVSQNSRTNRRYFGVKIANSKHIAFANTAYDSQTYLENCSVTNPTYSVFSMSSLTNGIGWGAYNCVFSGSGSAVCIGNYTSTSNRTTVQLIGCTITGFATVAGIVSSSEVYTNNIFANNGVVLVGNFYNIYSLISNNIFYGNTTAIGISDRSSASRFEIITNNSFVNNTTVFLANASNNQFLFEDYNHLYNNGTNYNGAALVAGANDIGGNPLFNNPGSLDFRLQSGSPLIGAGIAGSNIAGLKQMPSSGGSFRNTGILTGGVI